MQRRSQRQWWYKTTKENTRIGRVRKKILKLVQKISLFYAVQRLPRFFHILSTRRVQFLLFHRRILWKVTHFRAHTHTQWLGYWHFCNRLRDPFYQLYPNEGEILSFINTPTVLRNRCAIGCYLQRERALHSRGKFTFYLKSLEINWRQLYIQSLNSKETFYISYNFSLILRSLTLIVAKQTKKLSSCLKKVLNWHNERVIIYIFRNESRKKTVSFLWISTKRKKKLMKGNVILIHRADKLCPFVGECVKVKNIINIVSKLHARLDWWMTARAWRKLDGGRAAHFGALMERLSQFPNIFFMYIWGIPLFSLLFNRNEKKNINKYIIQYFYSACVFKI